MITVEHAIPEWLRPPAPVYAPSPAVPSQHGRRREVCQVAKCGQEVPPGMFVCGRCADRLFLELAGIPGLALALEAAHAKQLRFGATRPTAAADPDAEESPVPFEARASTTSAVLLDTLLAWVERIATERGIDAPPPELFRPMNTWTVVGAWLCAQVPWLRTSPLGPDAVSKLHAVLAMVRGVVDRPADLFYAGPCSGTVTDEAGVERTCGSDLLARPGKTEVTCKECGATYPLSDRRQWLLAKVEDMLLSATDLARAIDGLGVDVTPTLIRKWKERGRLAGHGPNQNLYRVGDVRDLVKATQARRRPR